VRTVECKSVPEIEKMPKFNPPESFPFDKPSEWPEWKARFSRYRIASKLTSEDGLVQVSSLIYAMGSEAEHIYKTFKFAKTGDDEKYDLVLDKFDGHFVPKRNIIHERAKFHQRSQ
jgi:hypothetical protein